METRKIAIKDLRPNKGQIPGVPENPRKWTDLELERLARSMEETPELVEARGCIVYPQDGKYIVLGGNMRLYAAKNRLRWTEIDCIILPGTTPAEKLKEIAMKDNSSFGQWDLDLIKQDWAQLDLESWGISIPEMHMAEPEKKAEDDHYDVEKKLAKIKTPKTKPGDIYLLGSHRLMCGDSTSAEDVARLMGNQKADLAVTDPPYNVNYEGGTEDALTIVNDNMSSAAFKTFLSKAMHNLANTLIAGAGAYIFYGSKEVVNFVNCFIEAGFLYKQELCWVKNSFVLGRQDYQWQHEPCLYGWKDGAPHYFIQDRTQKTVIDDMPNFDAMNKGELAEYCKQVFLGGGIPGDVIRENKPLRNAEHPTMKPIPLIGKLVQNSSRIGGGVTDLFGGSGSTLMACEQLGRRCFTMEYDPKYCDVIVDRWETFTGQKAQKL